MTADGGDGEQQFLPVISGRASAKLNRIAAKMTRPPKQKARPFAKLREEWKPTSARRCWTGAVTLLGSGIGGTVRRAGRPDHPGAERHRGLGRPGQESPPTPRRRPSGACTPTPTGTRLSPLPSPRRAQQAAERAGLDRRAAGHARRYGR
ncbi:hypothetical protein ACKI1I_06795 [Streptomyces turgidiscabies]|uniref:Uncharacterized protein n=1 Tax=Streptomyces turgidiscabies (strain Car8) TaxID=698760 RepID=L7EYW5_STRT8|nr:MULTISPECIES: hypothetical protein [Streptomyces]ELP64593.1 hypothetical protein STRTUCAR8_09198 [Streptomyces turgidiscabies Car8]MDX3491525.1 hypothetical protein [Streptomyces turgidiscabies]